MVSDFPTICLEMSAYFSIILVRYVDDSNLVLFITHAYDQLRRLRKMPFHRLVAL